MAETAEGTTTLAVRQAVVGQMIASGGVLYHPTLKLAQNVFAPGQGLALSAITEATFDGYSASASLPWSGTYIGEDGLVHATAGGVLFTKTAGSIPNTLFGAYLTDATGASLLAAGLFSTQIVMTDTGDGAWIVFDYVFGQ